MSPNYLIAKFEKYLEYKLESRGSRDRRVEAAATMEDMKRFLKTVSIARKLISDVARARALKPRDHARSASLSGSSGTRSTDQRIVPSDSTAPTMNATRAV